MNQKLRSRKSFVASKKIRQHLVEQLEERRLMAVASLPDQRLDISQPAVLLGYGNFQGSDTDLVSVSRTGRIDVAVNSGSNYWQTVRTTNSNETDIRGGATALLNSDPFGDLVLLTSDELTVLHGDGLAGWQNVQSIPLGRTDASLGTIQPLVTLLGRDLNPDLVVPLGQSNEIAIFSGRNGGLFNSPVYLASGGTTPSSITVADVIGGPNQDIIVGHADGSLTFFEGDSQGGFSLRSGLTQQLGLGVIVSLKASDLRQDGGIDIIAAGTNGVTILGRQGSGVVTTLENGDFSAGLTGWTVDVEGTSSGRTPGRVNANSGFAQFTENELLPNIAIPNISNT